MSGKLRLVQCIALASFMAGALTTGGCTPLGLAVGAGATAGVAASQERGAAQAAEDAATQLGINRRLLAHDANLFGRVTTAVIERRVLLTGVVASEADRDEVARIAWAGEHVREVINELQIAGLTTGDWASDLAITAGLRRRIMGDPVVVDINWTLDTVNGSIYLFGIAQNREEIERVVSYARSITGVRRIVDHMMLKDDPRRRQLTQ